MKYLFYGFLMIIQIAAYGCFSDSSGDATENNSTVTTNDTPSTASFRDDFNGTKVDNTVWQVATWQEESITSADRCYIADGKLNLLFRNNSGQYLGAAIQTRAEYLYGKWEARLKPTNIPGVLNSMFTIDWDDMSTSSSGNDGTHQEIDIEFLTKSFTGTDGQVHFAVHATGKTSFNLNPDLNLGFDPSADFHVWAIEITPERISWYVDNKLLHTYEYSTGGIVINGPYQLKFNVWTSTNWIGGPPAVNVDCIYQIDWVQFTPYKKK